MDFIMTHQPGSNAVCFSAEKDKFADMTYGYETKDQRWEGCIMTCLSFLELSHLGTKKKKTV